jgi:hypothetical protein
MIMRRQIYNLEKTLNETDSPHAHENISRIALLNGGRPLFAAGGKFTHRAIDVHPPEKSEDLPGRPSGEAFWKIDAADVAGIFPSPMPVAFHGAALIFRTYRASLSRQQGCGP